MPEFKVYRAGCEDTEPLLKFSIGHETPYGVTDILRVLESAGISQCKIDLVSNFDGDIFNITPAEPMADLSSIVSVILTLYEDDGPKTVERVWKDWTREGSFVASNRSIIRWESCDFGRTYYDENGVEYLSTSYHQPSVMIDILSTEERLKSYEKAEQAESSV